MATSAMRDSKNGANLTKRIAQYTGIEIETIQGVQEAQLIFHDHWYKFFIGKQDFYDLGIFPKKNLQNYEFKSTVNFNIFTLLSNSTTWNK
jgi:hypothetical protein